MMDRPYKVVQKRWGSEQWLANGPAYCGKVLTFKPGKGCSYHYHKQKLETLYLQGGRLVVSLEDPHGVKQAHVMEPGSQLTIQPYQRHQFTNTHEVGYAVLFEVSTQHFDDDSYREGEADG